MDILFQREAEEDVKLQLTWTPRVLLKGISFHCAVYNFIVWLFILGSLFSGKYNPASVNTHPRSPWGMELSWKGVLISPDHLGDPCTTILLPRPGATQTKNWQCVNIPNIYMIVLLISFNPPHTIYPHWCLK